MLKCPNCGKCDVTNIETRDAPVNRVRRRKSCNKCGYRFTTYEVYIPDDEDPKEHWMDFVKGKGGNRKHGRTSNTVLFQAEKGNG